MSVTQGDGSFDSGHNHFKPALIAILITAAIVVVTLAISGLPH
jgi:hypothetical protein